MDSSLLLFLKALLVGLSIAVPVGPIGLLAIHRTLDQGLRAGLATGLGAACADACYGALGAWGVALVVDALVGARLWLAVGGSALLLWMAWRSWRTPPAARAAPLPSRRELLHCFAGTFLLTLSNPLTILSFIAVFGALGGQAGEGRAALPMVAGVFLGSALWWLVLALCVARVRGRFDAAWRRRVAKGAGLLLAGFALWQGVGAWMSA